MHSSSVKNEYLDRKVGLPDFGKNDRKIESFISNRLIPAESMNVRDEYDESLLLSDTNLEKALV